MNAYRLFPLAGAAPSDPAISRWFDHAPAATREDARKWFDCLRACGPDVHEVLHDGQPTACVAGIALGYVAAYRAHVNVGFYLGSTLDDPAGLLEGSGRFMRHAKVWPGIEARDAALRELIAHAYRDLVQRLADRATHTQADTTPDTR